MRIHTFLHLFTEIVQIFHTKYILKIKKLSIPKLRDENNQPICKALSKEGGISQYPVWMIQKPWKFLAGACPRTPLEPCGACLGNRSVFILDLHLELSSGRLKGGLGCLILIQGLFTILFYLGTFITGHLTEGGCLESDRTQQGI